MARNAAFFAIPLARAVWCAMNAISMRECVMKSVENAVQVLAGQLHIFWCQSGVFGDARQHHRPDFVVGMKSKNRGSASLLVVVCDENRFVV